MINAHHRAEAAAKAAAAAAAQRDDTEQHLRNIRLSDRDDESATVANRMTGRVVGTVELREFPHRQIVWDDDCIDGETEMITVEHLWVPLDKCRRRIEDGVRASIYDAAQALVERMS